MNYEQKLKHPKWQKKRLEILKRDGWKCKLCGDKETTLNVHHKEYTADDPWNEPSENLITLCEHCHYEIGQGKININKEGIYKSDKWQNKYRIMFISQKELLIMRIYDENQKFIVGFCLPKSELFDIKKIINHVLKFPL